ncbi:MAG TPA: NADH-quinone oxidoreductase subunit M [Cytophagaceae bacterium]|jgi:NADH-quinone oxidoreductase subunit M|nr:NADH-quinone oxidoreductase subunit M [Cytophagaceae bacterium]
MNLTSSLIFLPFIAGLIAFLVPSKTVKYVAFIASLLELGGGICAYNLSVLSSEAQFSLNIPWIESLGISFYIGMDGISLLLVLLTTFLVPLIILSAFHTEYSKPNVFYGLILLMQSALIGVFVARDAFLFYIFWELALIPIYFICLLWGGDNKGKITFKFFLYTLVGSLIMLMGIIFLYLKTENGSFAYEDFLRVSLTGEEQTFIFWTFFMAFAIKMPIFPLHTWQPDTYTTAPAQGTMLLSGIMLKMGIYGVIRWMIPIAPSAVIHWGNMAVILSVIGIVYASIIAVMQKDFKRLIAYSSIAHVGLISAGIFSRTVEGMQGAMIQMLSHGFCVVGLFFVVDIIFSRTKTTKLEELGGIRNQAPFLTVMFVIVMLGSVALPLTSGFVGEFLLFTGLFTYNHWIAAIAGLSIILGAVYMLNTFQKVMLGEPQVKFSGFKDLVLSEKVVLVVISFFILYIGIYPKTFLELSEPSVKAIMNVASKNMTLR